MFSATQETKGKFLLLLPSVLRFRKGLNAGKDDDREMTPTEVDDQEEPDDGESKVEPNGKDRESEDSEEDDMDNDEKQKAEGKNWVKVHHYL